MMEKITKCFLCSEGGEGAEQTATKQASKDKHFLKVIQNYPNHTGKQWLTVGIIDKQICASIYNL